MSALFQMPGMLWLVILLPLCGALCNGVLALVGASKGRTINHTLSALIGVAAPMAAFGIAAWYFYILSYGTTAFTAPLIEPLFSWVAFPGWHIDVNIRADQLSMLMTLIITGVGSLIHLYSAGYMHDDEGFAKYFAYLNLFVFFMLLLVLGDNLLLMFVGWEGVGLCSYLLIGFWYDDPAKAYAGKKAFVVNRIGDFGFLIGIFLIWMVLHAAAGAGDHALLSFSTIQEYAMRPDSPFLPWATAICLCLFVGACGKSAQMPLYVWLPDAMAGPTPVSALIHAATMVTAGVYMIARLNFLFVLAPQAMAVIATVGALTAFFAATIGLVQDDIKKVLAYSTVSQLGFMFMAVGVGAFGAGVFHLMTHAFFKALMFLGSGSVIHAMHHEQRMSHYGGLRKELPVTFWTFLIGTLAIAGIFPFAGFFSKDAILWAVLNPVVYVPGHQYLWAIGVVTAGLTAFYMFRLVGMTFFGKRTAAGKHIHCHKEDSVAMLVPLVILALLSLIGGWWHKEFMAYLAPLFVVHPHTHDHHTEELVGWATMIWGALWALIAWAVYAQRSKWPDNMARQFKRVYQLLDGKYFIDELYQNVIVRPLLWISRVILWKGQDALIIDRGLVRGTGQAMMGLGRVGSWMQTGDVSNYLAAFVFGIVALFVWLVV